MAINKVVNKSTKSHGAMRNVLEYVLRDEKVKEGYVEIDGPFSGETVNYDTLYRSWLAEKRLWEKDSGRMYAHNIISFHKDEPITPGQVLEIGKAFAEEFFSGFQYLVGVHQDKEHLHCHIVTNSVSYLDGRKLHQTKRDLEKQKHFTNNICRSRGLAVTEKGRHFDGTTIEQGEISAWSKDKYNLLINDGKKSFVADCAIALLETVPISASREEFIAGMLQRGWAVHWTDSRKHIVFQNEDGQKVRDSNIEKTFAGLEVNKEALTNEFTKQNERRLVRLSADRERERAEAELRRYYAELESAAAGLATAKAVRDDSETSPGNTAAFRDYPGYVFSNGTYHAGAGTSEDAGKTSGPGKDTESFVRELDALEGASGEERDNRIAERTDRDAEQLEPDSARRDRELKTKQQRTDETGTVHKRRSRRQSSHR